MSRVVEHLAELTGFRDRDVLDVTLVGALKDLLRPASVAIYRSVGEAGQQHWLTRARMALGDTTAAADPLWTAVDTLPVLASQPDRYACLRRQETITLPAIEGGMAMAYFPLAGDRESMGVLEIATPHTLSHDDIRLVGSILRIYRNVQGLLDYSERDMLTGLLNRKTFDESFMRTALPEFAQPQGCSAEPRRHGTGRDAWLGLIDIDHFKQVNDRCGHLIGDEVLLLVSRLMRSNFRFHDHLYRFGGEEFVVLMRCGAAPDAALAMERLRANIEGYGFPQAGRITVSIGFTALGQGDTPSAAFERADQAVYFAKQTGRNKVCHHAELVAAGQLADPLRKSNVEIF